jgi:hypothetical protein
MDATLTEILQSIDELGNRGSIPRQRAFAAWFAINFFNIDEDDALEAAAADGGNDQGIDLVFADVTSEEIIVIQSHCPTNLTKITPKNKWDAVTAALPYIADPMQLISVGRPDLSETLSNLKKSYPSYKIAVGLITLGLRSTAIDACKKAHESQKAYSNFSYFYYPQEDIIGKYRSLVESELGIPEDTILFSSDYFQDSGAYGGAWIGSVGADELKRLHATYGDRLFAGNVRLFIGARKGGINEQIIRTAQENPGNFWALNNGITIVADTVEVSADGNPKKIDVKRFSIVNGCQTTSSLVRAGADSTAKVLARVIVAKATLRNEVVQYNNSQNAVKIWTVRAVDGIQNELRREFSASGIDYAPKQEGARRKKSASVIELDKVAQYLASSQEKFLIQAIDNKSELFDQPYQELFYRGIKAPEVYLAWLTGQLSDEERHHLFEAIEKDENAGLLGVTSVFWIIYCAYKIIERNSDTSSSKLTVEKMKTTEFRNALSRYIKKAAAIFYDAAVDTYDRKDYGSFRSTLRSGKFLQKINSKINMRIARLEKNSVPNLDAVCKSIKSS